MCRWFAYISETEPCLLEDVLITPHHSLAQQVHDHYLPKLIHHSGSGDDAEEKEIAVRNLLFNTDGTNHLHVSSAVVPNGRSRDWYMLVYRRPQRLRIIRVRPSPFPFQNHHSTPRRHKLPLNLCQHCDDCLLRAHPRNLGQHRRHNQQPSFRLWSSLVYAQRLSLIFHLHPPRHLRRTRS